MINKMKTKTIRAKMDDAFAIEQAARELAAEMQKVVKVSDIVGVLMENLDDAKKKIKARANEISE